MEDHEQQEMLSFEATIDEYKAIHHCIDCYIYFLEATMASSADRALIIAALHSMQLRPRDQLGNIVGWQCSQAEALAFAGAAMCYTRLVTMAMPYSAGEAETKRLVIAFQKRYLDTMKPRE